MACQDFPSGGLLRNEFIVNPAIEKTVKGRIKEIKIYQLDHGYILEVGCKKIALDSPEKIIFGLKKYFANPENVEHQFLKGAFKFEK